MGLEQCEERPNRPERHHERRRPEGEGHRGASPPPETPRYRALIPPGSKARLHPGITRANDMRSLQSHIFLSKTAPLARPPSAPTRKDSVPMRKTGDNQAMTRVSTANASPSKRP